MTPTDLQNALAQSLFKQLYLSKMMNVEHRYFLKFDKVPSGLKNALKRCSDAYDREIEAVKTYAPNSKDAIQKHIENEATQERIAALSNIMGVLMLAPLEDLTAMEDYLEKAKVKRND